MIGFSVSVLVKGKFPAIGGIFKNYVVFGEKNVNPKLLVGSKARRLSFVLAVIFSLIVFVIYIQNQILREYSLVSISSIAIGIVAGIIWHKIALKLV